MKSRASALAIVLLFLAITPAFVNAQSGPCYIMATATEGGIITPSGTVEVTYGADQAFQIKPNDGCYTKELQIDGFIWPTVPTTFTFTNVTTNHKIYVVFDVVISVYTINASAGEGGSISPYGEVKVNAGEDIIFIITPGENHIISNVIVDGETVGTPDTYEFLAVQEDHEIKAEFQAQVAHEVTIDTLTCKIVTTKKEGDTEKKEEIPVTKPVKSGETVICRAVASCTLRDDITVYSWAAMIGSDDKGGFVYPEIKKKKDEEPPPTVEVNKTVNWSMWNNSENLVTYIIECKATCSGNASSEWKLYQITVRPTFIDRVDRLIGWVNQVKENVAQLSAAKAALGESNNNDNNWQEAVNQLEAFKNSTKNEGFKNDANEIIEKIKNEYGEYIEKKEDKK